MKISPARLPHLYRFPRASKSARAFLLALSFFFVTVIGFGCSASSTPPPGSPPVAPVITTQPTNQTVTTGQPATFSVVATGTAPMTYQWQKNGANIAGATLASYTTPATTTSDSGSTFVVIVSNSAGTVTSNAATLTVNPASVAPSITTQPANQTVTAGQTATFSVVASGTAPLSYQWQKNGVNISGATATTYTTPATTTSDSGSTFVVVVSNSAGSVTSSTATLTVEANTTPTLVWSKSSANTTGINTNSYTTNLPTSGTLSGNVIIATFQYGSGSGASASVKDEQGDNFLQLTSASDGNQTLVTFCAAPTPGARVLTISFSGGAPPWVSLVNASEWFNLSCTLDGSSSNTDAATVTASVAAGSFSTVSDGDLIYQAAIEDGPTGSETWTSGASPWALLSASSGLAGANTPQVSQYQVQATHGSINPTLSMSSADTWVSVAIALKVSNSGTAPPPGIRIVHMQEESVPPGQSSPFSLQFPSSGNLLITASIDSPDYDIVSISDNNHNTHTQIGSAFNDGFTSGDVQTFYVANAATSSTLKLTFAMTGSPVGGSDFFLYDVTGAAASPYDTVAGRQTATMSAGIGTLSGPTITPSTANGLVIVQVGVNSNSIDAVSPGFFAGTIPNPLGQTNPTNQNNGWAFDFNATTASRQYLWTTDPVGSDVAGWASTAVAFKAQ